jgi:sialate O-acetylesterase
MNKKMLSLALMTAIAVGAQAKVKLPHLVSDNMVIQQQSDVRLWGWAKPGKTVVATTSWSNERSEAKADKDGRWLLTVKSPKASYEPLHITFYDGESAVTIKNVLAGEVWVCAGQSNMEMPVKGFGNCPVLNYNHEVLGCAGKRQVRSAKIPSIMRMTPQEDADTQWRECSPQTVSEFSATGYFFAKVMNQALDIPIGLIEANKGGSRVESWLTKENLEKYTQEPTDSAGIVAFKREWDYHRALVWGNGTFNPILNYTVKGILY